MADRPIRRGVFESLRIASAVFAIGLLVSPGRAKAPSPDDVPVARADEKGKADSEKLAGTWTCVSGVNNGRPIAEATVQKLRLTLTKERYKTERGEDVLFDSTYTIDASKDPKHINLIGTEGENKGKAAQGIYSLDGDMLKICYTMPGKERPTAFESKQGSEATLIIWKRAKP